MEQERKMENINKVLEQEILVMVEADQKIRKSHGLDSEVDKRNTERIKEIIRQYGWPGRSLVGKEAANGVWLLAQHADHDIEFQKLALELLKEAVAKGEAEKRNEAYLMDRVQINSGHLQIFGTQFYKDKEGKFGPRPIANQEHLEEKRKEFGLEPFSEYEQRMQKINKKFEKKES